MDLNGDGNIDLLGAGFAGFPYILYRNEDGSFNEAVILKDKSGKDINLGKYWDFELKKYVELEKDKNEDKGNFVKAHDWDDDGDLDLIISGNNVVKLRINEGTKTNPVFGTENIEILQEHYADAIIDWDGDGLWDILGGSKKGGIYFYKNKGVLGAPSFESFECLLEPEEFIDKINGGKCGITQLAVTDYNNDGKQDLVIGNNCTQNIPAPILSKEREKERDKLIKKKEKLSEELSVFYNYFREKYGDSKTKLKEARENNADYQKLRKEYTAVSDKLSKLIAGKERHGYVWVSLRE